MISASENTTSGLFEVMNSELHGANVCFNCVDSLIVCEQFSHASRRLGECPADVLEGDECDRYDQHDAQSDEGYNLSVYFHDSKTPYARFRRNGPAGNTRSYSK